MLSFVAFFVWLSLPLIVSLYSLTVKRTTHRLLTFILAMLAGYCVLLLSVHLRELELVAEVKRHEASGQWSMEAHQASENLANDTGRRLAPFTGIPFTFIWYTVVIALIYCMRWIGRVLFKRRPRAANETFTAKPEVDDSNPYQPPAVYDEQPR